MKAIFLATALLAFVSFVRSETCPAEEDISPCMCDEEEDGEIFISCYAEGTTVEQLRAAFKNLAGKKDIQFEIDEIDLGNLPSNLFEGLDVKKIDMSHCELDSLQDDESKPALSGLEDSLEELVILSSFTEDNKPTKLRLGHLRRLKELDLSYNAITELGDDWFSDGPTSLEYVTFSNNGIEKIGDNAFAKLTNLRQLSLDGNRFGSIKRSMLPHTANHLATLELDNNAFESLPQDIFSGMSALNQVSLRMNGIKRLEQKTWQPVWQQLDVIYLEGNPVECDSHMNWLFELRQTSSIYGSCHAPRDKVGVSLQEFIDSRGQ